MIGILVRNGVDEGASAVSRWRALCCGRRAPFTAADPSGPGAADWIRHRDDDAADLAMVAHSIDVVIMRRYHNGYVSGRERPGCG
jgi:hypothetical protein